MGNRSSPPIGLENNPSIRSVATLSARGLYANVVPPACPGTVFVQNIPKSGLGVLESVKDLLETFQHILNLFTGVGTFLDNVSETLSRDIKDSGRQSK